MFSLLKIPGALWLLPAAAGLWWVLRPPPYSDPYAVKPVPTTGYKPPTLDTKSGLCSPTEQLYYTVRKGDTYEAIAQAVVKESYTQSRQLRSWNPDAEVIYVYSWSSSSVGEQATSRLPPEQEPNSVSGAWTYVAAFPKEGTKLELPDTWNVYCFRTTGGKGWASDPNKNVIYPPCSTEKKQPLVSGDDDGQEVLQDLVQSMLEES